MWSDFKPEELVKLCNILNPDNEPGRMTLISRFGAESVEKYLPKLIKVIKKEGLNVIWSCDLCSTRLKQPQDLRQDLLTVFKK